MTSHLISIVVHLYIWLNKNSGIRTSVTFMAQEVGKYFSLCMVLYHKGLVLIVATVMERLCCRAVVHSLNPDETRVVTVQTEL